MENETKTARLVVERGNYFIGRNLQRNGETVESNPPKWEPNPEGCAVCVTLWDGEKNEQIGEAALFAAWDSIGIDNRIREMLALDRRNFPTPEEIYKWTKAWDERDISFCEICQYSDDHGYYDCKVCPVAQIKADMEDEDNA